MIAEYLNLERSNSVKICTFCVENLNGELVKSPYEYPKEQVGEVKGTINLFKSNVFVEHFDVDSGSFTGFCKIDWDSFSTHRQRKFKT